MILRIPFNVLLLRMTQFVLFRFQLPRTEWGKSFPILIRPKAFSATFNFSFHRMKQDIKDIENKYLNYVLGSFIRSFIHWMKKKRVDPYE